MNRFLFFALCLASLGCASTSTPIQPDPIYRETQVRHDRPRIEGEMFDPQEADPALTDIFSNVDKLAEREVANVPRKSGFIFHFWKAKQEILSEEYGISWKSPAEMNPEITYGRYGQPKITDEELASITSVLKQNMVGSDEDVISAWRMFTGEVFAATKEPDSGLVRHYRLIGHDQIWRVVGVGVFQE